MIARLTGTIVSKHPTDIVEEIKAPVLGLYGAADQSIPVLIAPIGKSFNTIANCSATTLADTA